jgi:hypothetical protein
MTDNEYDDDTIITLDLPIEAAAQLTDWRQRFGDEFVDGLLTGLLRKACKHVEGRLALRGVRMPKNHQ